MKIGRNDPCPCGSGKKFKRCCINQRVLGHEMESPVEPPIILINEIGDYGNPEVDDGFFERNLRDHSAQRLFYTCLLRPEVESVMGKYVKQFIFRGKDEAKRIRGTNDVIDLISILKQEPDILNHRLLMDKTLKYPDAIVPMLIMELSHTQDDCFIELAIRILYESKIDPSLALLELINSSPLNAYALSVICLLIGMTGPQQSLKPLWDRFHFFEEKYPRENFSQGPLLGLYELRARNAAITQNENVPSHIHSGVSQPLSVSS